MKKQLLKLSKPKLIKICKQKKVSSAGNKNDIINRLIQKNSKKKNKKNLQLLSKKGYTPIIQKYIKILSSTLPNVEQVILIEITAYSLGIIISCDNDWCNNDVFLSNYHQQEGTIAKDRLSDNTYIDDFERKYYYNPSKNIRYCVKCRSIMKLCRDVSIMADCDGIIFDIDSNEIKTNTAYQVCGCSVKSKLCFEHDTCNRCGVPACCNYDESVDDNCVFRNCSSCQISGCIKCISMISNDGVLESLPPIYMNPVYKCKNECYSGGKISKECAFGVEI